MRGPEGNAWRFDPGALCLELLTTGGPGAQSRHERLHRPEDLVDWLTGSRLRLPPAQVEVTATDVVLARGLRDALWRLARGWAGMPATSTALFGDPVPVEADLATVNATAAEPDLAPRLRPDGAAGWVLPASGARALATVARDAVALRAGPYAERIRSCAAADCHLVFVDVSRPGTRRWCSMARCGNRAKARANRRRAAG
jgi:predicted RNA-binding Zn ribbon-like protein